MINQKNNPSGPDPEDELQTLEVEEQPVAKKSLSLVQLWDRILHFGLGDQVLRIATAVASLLLVGLVIWVMSKFFLTAEKNVNAAISPIENVTATPLLPVENTSSAVVASSIGIMRQAQVYTILPPKPRNEVIEYTIQEGDTLFGIAEKYGLQPESLLWSNRHILGDDPHNLYPGVTILIPPYDGAIYEWHTGDGLNGVSSFYNVTPDVIVDYAGNHLDRSTLGDFSLPNIPEGTLLFIPNGVGEFTDWLPVFTRETAATASTLGPGFCGSITEGPIGYGTYTWPTTETYLSGYDYSPSTNHRGIDIAGAIGNPIYSVDRGVVVYSGWNNGGYGNLIIVDHGDGWQSVYAHLDVIYKSCAAYVEQGEQIGTLGTTGNSTGPHLHFELRNTEYGTVNPWDFLQY